MFFEGGRGGGGWGGGSGCRWKGVPTEKKVFAYFCAHALYKISISWLKWFSRFNINKRNNGRKRAITLPVLRNSVKSHLNMDPKQHSEFQDPSSSNSLHIQLTRFSYWYNSKV